ncbi:hypothetical protein [Sphingomonas astaxanthinifaciens]|uniref:GTPase n=1 Tax=Sphingomonas astaxanthinifaciens DSM 22298 TaxID=1123267 RepID=A0ABQ5ZBP6_9SPHN|nr:hypothetical protein [Sphingomonas astaxanthinifaciens]GLR48022.1 hypothetical protein GCM10007925_17350 [Sphingomonas astaxanthinifaciens DSM 22298]
MSAGRLIFVYNADAGLLNALKDAWAKAVSPETYPCALCATTYGAVSMRPEWKAYVKRLPFEATFLHRDEWQRANPASTEALPAIFLQRGTEPPRLLVSAENMPLGQSLAELIAMLDARLGR